MAKDVATLYYKQLQEMSEARYMYIIYIHINIYIYIWLMVSTILKHISQWEGLSHILWTKKSSKPPTT